MFVLSDRSGPTFKEKLSPVTIWVQGLALRPSGLLAKSSYQSPKHGFQCLLDIFCLCPNLCVSGYSDGSLPIINFVVSIFESVKWHLAFLLLYSGLVLGLW